MSEDGEGEVSIALPQYQFTRELVNTFRGVVLLVSLGVFLIRPSAGWGALVGVAALCVMFLSAIGVSALRRFERATLEPRYLLVNSISGTRRIFYDRVVSVAHRRIKRDGGRAWVLILELRDGEHEELTTTTDKSPGTDVTRFVETLQGMVDAGQGSSA